MNLQILAYYLEQNNLGTRGVDIFIREMPLDCKKGILLKIPLDGIEINHELPGYYKGQIQLIVRAAKQETGNNLSDSVMNVMKMYNVTLAEENNVEKKIKINYIRPQHLPIVYPRSDGNGIEWSMNFDCCYIMV